MDCHPAGGTEEQWQQQQQQQQLPSQLAQALLWPQPGDTAKNVKSDRNHGGGVLLVRLGSPRERSGGSEWRCCLCGRGSIFYQSRGSSSFLPQGGGAFSNWREGLPQEDETVLTDSW